MTIIKADVTGSTSHGPLVQICRGPINLYSQPKRRASRATPFWGRVSSNIWRGEGEGCYSLFIEGNTRDSHNFLIVVKVREICRLFVQLLQTPLHHQPNISTDLSCASSLLSFNFLPSANGWTSSSLLATILRIDRSWIFSFEKHHTAWNHNKRIKYKGRCPSCQSAQSRFFRKRFQRAPLSPLNFSFWISLPISPFSPPGNMAEGTSSSPPAEKLFTNNPSTFYYAEKASHPDLTFFP